MILTAQVSSADPSSLIAIPTSGYVTFSAGTTGSAAAASYSITYLPGQLTVTPAPLTIAANNLTKNFDAPNPALTWTASGFEDGNTTSALTTTPQCTTTATTTSADGSYPIICSGAADTNYSISYG